jgi:hypothetical protein
MTKENPDAALRRMLRQLGCEGMSQSDALAQVAWLGTALETCIANIRPLPGSIAVMITDAEGIDVLPLGTWPVADLYARAERISASQCTLPLPRLSPKEFQRAAKTIVEGDTSALWRMRTAAIHVAVQRVACNRDGSVIRPSTEDTMQGLLVLLPWCQRGMLGIECAVPRADANRVAASGPEMHVLPRHGARQ